MYKKLIPKLFFTVILCISVLSHCYAGDQTPYTVQRMIDATLFQQYDLVSNVNDKTNRLGQLIRNATNGLSGGLLINATNNDLSISNSLFLLFPTLNDATNNDLSVSNDLFSAIQSSTNLSLIAATNNDNLLSSNGTNNTLLSSQNGTNESLFIGANATNNDNRLSQNSTNESLFIGLNNTNESTRISNNATNQSLFMGANATNDDLLFGLGSTNEALLIGANSTNESLLIGSNSTNESTRISQNATNESLLIGSNGTNESTRISNNATNESLLIGSSATNNDTLISQNATNQSTVVSNGLYALVDKRVQTNDTRTLTFAGPIFDTNLTASRIMLSDANKQLSSASASGAVSINADGSATTFAQIQALAPSVILTNGNLNDVTMSNAFRIDTTHSLSLSNMTANTLAKAGADNTISSIANGGANTILHGATPPSYSVVDVSSADITGTLKAGSFPALTGDVTTSAGAVATTIAAQSATVVPNNTGGWTEFKVSGSDVTRTAQTLADVTGLVTGTLSTSSLYDIQACLYVTSSSSAGCEYGVNCTGSGAACGVVFHGAVTTTTSAVTGVSTLNSAEATAYLTGSQTSVVMLEGWVTSGTGSPVISIEHLKVTSGTSTVKIGSVLRIRKM